MTITLLAANITAHLLQTTIIVGCALLVLAVVRITVPHVRYFLLRALLAFCVVLPVIGPKVTLPATDDPLNARPTAGRAWSSSAGRSVATPASPRHSSSQVMLPRLMATFAGWLVAALAAGALVRLVWVVIGLTRLRHLRQAGATASRSADYNELQRRIRTSAELRFVSGSANR